MLHRRAIIRKAVLKILLGKTSVGKNVFANQSTPAFEENLPCIKIYPRGESAEKFNETPRELKRIIELVIEIIAAGPEEPNDSDKETVDDQLDAIAHEVECELSKSDTINDTADDIILTSTDFEFEGGGARPIGSCRLTYAVVYHQEVPDSIDKRSGIEDFKTAHTDWHVGHDDEDPDLTNKEAEDDVELPQP